MFRLSRICVATALTLAAGPVLAQDATPAPAPEAAPAAPAVEVTADTVLAEVNGTKITAGQLIALRQNLPAQYQQLPDDVLFSGLLDQVIQQAVLAGTLDAPTKAEQIQIDNQSTAMKAGLAVQRVLAHAVSDEALKAAYDAKFANAEPAKEYNASHILVPTKEEAQEIYDELKAGGDFAKIAQEKSKDPGSGANGGSLGWFSTGMMVKPFEDAVVGATVGEVTEPVETQFGWHVILVNDTRIKQAPTLDEVRDELVKELQDKAVQDAIAAATAKAEVRREDVQGIDPSFLKKTELLDQ